jgi:hypothetical protein
MPSTPAKISTTQQQDAVSEEISDELKNIIYETGLEKEDYEIALVNGKQTFIAINNYPEKLKKGYTTFYSMYNNMKGLTKRAGKKVTIPGFEDINLMMEQGTNFVYELSTGYKMSSRATTQKEILKELEILFKEKNVRTIIANTPKINTNITEPGQQQDQVNRTEEEPDGQTGEGTTENPVPEERNITVNQYTFTLKPDGKIYYGNGNELTEQTIKNKVYIRKELQDGTLRVSTFDKKNYYVLSDNRIIDSGKTVGDETVSNSLTKEKILDAASLYKKSC